MQTFLDGKKIALEKNNEKAYALSLSDNYELSNNLNG